MQNKWKAGNHKKGFTTVELVVVTIIILILSGGIILSLVSWYRNAQFRKQNEYAQTIFSAVQNRLTEYSYSGTLEELEDLLEENGAKSIDSELADKKIIGDDGTPYDMDQIWYESEGKSAQNKSKYQGTIYSLIGTPKDYQAYKSDNYTGMTEEKETLTEALYEMLETYLYDTSILSDGVVCVEFSASDGQVFAALYSDKQENFTYGTPEDDKTINICDRTRSKRKKEMLGYYGVDTMAKATTPKAEKPVITDVQLNNEETLNLSFKLGKVKSAWNQLTYQVDVYNEASNHIGLSIILNAKDTTDGGKYKWPDSYNSKKQVLGTVKRYWYDKKGNKTSAELGKYKFYLYVEQNGVVHLVLDAADLSATSQNYVEAYDEKGIGTSGYTRSKYPNMDTADEILNESYSFHRFGLSAERIYCKIKGSGTGYKPTALKKSNESDVYYGDKSTSAEEKGKTTYSYEIANARHLYNMRYIEDIEKKKDSFKGNEGSLDEYSYTVPQKMTWILTEDVDWKKLIKDKFYFDSGEVEEKDTQFLSILQLRKDSVFETEKYSLEDWKLSQDNHRIKGLEITYEANEKAEIQDDDDLESTGLFLENEGEIRGITLDGIQVTGINNVGAFCGVNEGALENLVVDDTYGESRVSGKPYDKKADEEDDKKSGKKKDEDDSDEWGECIGGIFGVHESENASRDLTFQKLLNRADVTGSKFVGGITGWMTGKGNQEITVKDCQNYGAVYADEESENPMFIGGIMGYAQNQKQKQDKELFAIQDCVSSPQYDSKTTLEIIQGVKDGTRQLKGTYVGGIVGYNQGCEITDCSTENESRSRQGYVFGDKYVGGIVGISSGLTGGIDGNGCVNEANVIGNTYVGGIIGCNAAPVVQNGHYLADDEYGTPFKDVADTIYAVRPEKNRDLEVEIKNWTNQGVVAATGDYAGGITGYNTGRILGCNSDVGTYSDQEILSAIEDMGRDYAGGIAGYNNGIIGNTSRDENGSATGSSGETLSTVCYISGRHYVGGIVGYNDVDALVEDYELTGGHIKSSGDFVGGYAGLNASSCLLEYTQDTQTGNHDEHEARVLVSKPNEVTGKYFVGGIIGGNLVCTNSRINTVFEVDNFLGSINAKAYAGGFIGLNVVLKSGGDHKARIETYQKALLVEAGQTESVASNFAEAISDSVGFANSPSLEMSITGQGTKTTASRLGSLTAEDVFAGGVIGYSKDSNYLLIKDVENLTPITAGGIISESAAQEQSKRADAATFAYAYAGGIIGKVGSNTTLDNCRNRDVGDVSVSENATYTGGLCEINRGTIQNCQASSVGSNVKDKVGGICGVNLGNIEDCWIEGSTITGRNDVGGITAENFGGIDNISLKSANISASGNNAGAIAGYNGEFGSNIGDIMVYARGTLETIESVKVSGNTNVGGLVGKNEGNLWSWPYKEDSKINMVKISGSVSGSRNVGGIVGQSSSELNYFINQCNVTASVGNAGGIVGAYNGNSLDGSIGNCENQGSVTATAGNAGGIVAENNGEIVYCMNRGNILAAAGNVGGISALNTGVIKECEVTGSVTVSVTGRDAAGGISGENSGDIIQCSIDKAAVHNTSKSTKESLVGGIAGKNKGEIQLSDGKILNSTVQAYADGSSAGGIAGENTGNGIISGEAASTPYTEIKNVDLVTASSISSCNLGGVAGRQSSASSVIKGCRVLDTQIGKLSLLGNSDQGYGGIAGTNAGQIQNCSFDGNVTAGGNGSNIVNLGGITGKNLASGLIEQCYIGLDAEKDHTVIQSGVGDTKDENKVYTAYLGGITGWNFGTIQDCDNQGKGSIDKVAISGNGGIVGGIVGRNESGAVVTGLSETKKLSTGENWSIKHYYYINDSGTGGICGWSGSGQGMKYVENYADVANLSGIKNSTAVGGIIGRLENQESNDFTIENSKNAGNISGPSNTGGFVGRWKYNGGTIKSSSNTGNVGNNNSLVSGGIIASLYDLTDDTSIMVTGCSNLGKIAGADAGGVVGKPNMCNSSNLVVLNDCINAGDISANNGAGIILNAENNTSVTLNRCRNYGSGTKGTFYGIEFSKHNLIKIQDCFDFSGKGLVQKLNDDSKIVNSYYYTSEITAGMTEEEAKQYVEAAKVKVTDAEKAVAEAKEKLNQVNDAGYGDNVYYDSLAEKNFYDHDVMKHVSSGYQGGFNSVFEGNIANDVGYQLENAQSAIDIKEGNPLNLNFTLAKTVPGLNQDEEVQTLNYPKIKSFGIYWGANSSGRFTRAYIYTVSFITQDNSEKYLKLGTENSLNKVSVNFKDGPEVSAYENYGNVFCKALAVDDPNDATKFLTYGLNKNTEIRKKNSYARFELPSNENVKEIKFYVSGIASSQEDISQFIESGKEVAYSTAGTVNKFIASTTQGAADLVYDPANTENHVLSVADAAISQDWQEANLAYENAKEDYQKAVEALKEAEEKLEEIRNGGSIEDDVNAPLDDPEKSGSSMYAAKTEADVTGAHYKLKSASKEGKNILNMIQIPSKTAKDSGRKLRNITYSDLDQPKEDWDYTLVEQYYLDAYNLPLDDKTPEFTVRNAGGKVTLRIKEIPGAYGYQMCYQSQDQSDISNLSAPVYIPNVVTTTENNAGYIEYELSPDRDWYQSQMNFYIRAVNGTAYMNYYDSQENFKDEQGQYKAPTASDWNQDGQFAAKNVSKWSQQSIQLFTPQAAPKVHLELVYLEDRKAFGWKPVLENPGDFKEGTEILVYASTTITSKVVSKDNLKFTINVGADGKYTSKAEKDLPMSHLNNINYATKASALEGAASESALTMYQSAFYGISNLKGNDLYYDTWKGFYGNTPDSLSYQVGERPNTSGTNDAVDLYIASELVVSDYLTLEDGTKIDVAVSNGQSHVTSIGSNTVISELSGLPTELLEDYTNYTIRTYPWKNQWYICQYGHVVKEGAKADELLVLTDADRNGEAIFQEDAKGGKELRPGYSIRLEKDGTYTVVYSVFMEYSSEFGKQFKQNKLNVNESEDGQRTSVDQTENAGKQIPIQPNPVISEDSCTVQPKGDGAEYTFTWDEASVVSGAVYNLQLYGMTSEGRTLLASQDNVKTNQYTFEDSNGNWNYKNMTLRVIRVGSPEDDASAESKKLPFYTENTFNVKIALERISKPKVSLHQGDKDHLYYDVEWTGISHTEQDQVPDYLDGYAVTAERTQDDTVCSQYDAAAIQALKEDLEAEGYTISQGEDADTVIYSKIIENSDSEIYKHADKVEKTVTFTKNSDGTYTADRKEIWTFLSLSGDEMASSAKLVRAIDLGEFTGDTKLKISVKALASADSSVYKDGPAGVGSEMTLPKRLDVPDMEALLEKMSEPTSGDKLEMQETYSLQEFMTLDQMNVLEDTSGLHINIWDHSRPSSGKYELNMTFYDTYPFDMAQGERQTGEIAENVEPKYLLKDASALLEGSLKKGSYHLPGTGIEVVDDNGAVQTLKLSDLAGMYAVLAFRATADNEISSLWTYEDRHKVSYVQFRIPRAQNDTPKLSESQTEVYYSGDSHTEEDSAGGAAVKQTTLTGTVEDYAQDFLFQMAHHSQKVDGMSDYNTLLEMDWIYAKKGVNGYSIYLLSTDKEEMENLGTEGPDTAAAKRMDVQNARYVGELPIGGSLDLPYRLDLQTGAGSMTTTSYLKCQSDGQENTQLILVLADAEAVNGTVVSDYVKTEFVKAAGLSGNFERYEDSKTVSWYRGSEGTTPADESPSYGTAALSAREGYSLEVPLTGDLRSHYIYRITDLAEYGSTYAKTKGSTVDSVLFLKDYENGTLLPEFKKIEDNRIAGGWKSAGESISLFDETTYTDSNVKQPKVYLNTRDDKDQYVIVISGASKAAQVYLERVVKADGEVYYHVFYNDTETDLSSAYPMAGTKKEKKYQRVSDLMVEKDGTAYPSCSEEQNAYYLGDILEDTAFGLPYMLETANEVGTELMKTQSKLEWSENTFALTLPDVIGIEENIKKFALNQDTQQITFQASGEKYQTNWWYQDGKNAVKQTDTEQSSCTANLENGILNIVYENRLYGYQAIFDAALDVDKKTCTVTETQGGTTYGILFQFIGTDGDVQFKYAPAGNAEFEVQNLDSITDIKVRVIDWAGGGCTQWQELSGIQIRTAEEQPKADPASEEDSMKSEEGQMQDHDGQNGETQGNPQKEDAQKNDEQENSQQNDSAQKNTTQNENAQSHNAQNGTAGDEPKPSDDK
ncbi:MAG: hypothetical protein MSA90_00990 [Faecalicatena sp.]|uniref:GLUG motif-containing protein n=1 Tax=Faecalicatena sp. TaxID=2005360 RepID=UPI0025896DE4|nr:GLUG motif-containing protein [Faecalicatena sp.]MCI6464030.1 hypothetical protein [Faecalicatena sp.]